MVKRVSAETPQSGAPRAGLNGIGPVSAPKTLATNLVVHGIGLFSSFVSLLYLCVSCKGTLSWNVVRGMAYGIGLRHGRWMASLQTMGCVD